MTGHEVIDSLQDLQVVANRIVTPDTKISHVREVMGVLATHSLLGHQFMISSGWVLGRHPDAAPDKRLVFSNGIFFVGELDTYGYVIDEDIPLDSLMLGFTHPEVIGVEPGEETEAFRNLTLEVPVLSIDSCMLAEAA